MAQCLLSNWKVKNLPLQYLENVRMIKFAESLGGVETLITYPTTQTHADVPEEIQEKRTGSQNATPAFIRWN